MLDRYKRAVDFGDGIYQITTGPSAHAHAYYKWTPWSRDGSKFLFFEYERENEEGRVCLMDLETGDVDVIGTSTYWCAHTLAYQIWLGETNKILYTRARRGDKIEYALLDLDGEEHTFLTDGHISDANDEIMLAQHPFGQIFPDDGIGDRSRVGVSRVDPETGETTMVKSVEDFVEAHPRADEIRDYHMFTKQYLIHPRLPLVGVNLVNGQYDNLFGEPRVREFHSLNLETGKITLVGSIAHHPSWHPKDARVLAYLEHPDRRRIGLFTPDENGDYQREDFPEYPGRSGHPSYDPAGRLISVDGGTFDGSGDTCVNVFDPEKRETHQISRHPGARGGGYGGYPHGQRKRRDHETYAEFLERATFGPDKAFLLQDHPAWDRTGRYLAFNAMVDDTPQVFVADVASIAASWT